MDEKKKRWIVEVEVLADTEYDARRNVENWRSIVGFRRTTSSDDLHIPRRPEPAAVGDRP